MLDHYHYVRWGAVNVLNLITSHDTCPDIYRNFLSNNFSFQKCYRIKWLLSKSTSRAMKKGVDGATQTEGEVKKQSNSY